MYLEKSLLVLTAISSHSLHTGTQSLSNMYNYCIDSIASQGLLLQLVCWQQYQCINVHLPLLITVFRSAASEEDGS